MHQAEISEIVRRVIARLQSTSEIKAGQPEAGGMPDDCLGDLSQTDLRQHYLVNHPHEREAFMALKSRTPARIGAGRAGARYKTATMLRFGADHAAAQAAVFSDVADGLLERTGWSVFQTACASKDEYLTRPDKGRTFSPEMLQEIKRHVGGEKQVVLYAADGLSSRAVEANAADMVQVIQKGLEGIGISVAAPFFVRYGRVGSMDALGSAVSADVFCVLLGERPGLVTAESMSAYIAYRPSIGMPESRRTVLANIHRGGTPAVEAGAYAVELIARMLEKKASGIGLSV